MRVKIDPYQMQRTFVVAASCKVVHLMNASFLSWPADQTATLLRFQGTQFLDSLILETLRKRGLYFSNDNMGSFDAK